MADKKIAYTESQNVSYVDGVTTSDGKEQPIGLSALFSGNDSRQIMKPYVWWPEELLPKPQSKQSITFRV